MAVVIRNPFEMLNEPLLTEEEQKVLAEMPIGRWFYAIPEKFVAFIKELKSKGFVEERDCTFDKTGIKWTKWRRIK